MALRNTSERYEYIYGSNVRKLETDTAGKQTAKTVPAKTPTNSILISYTRETLAVIKTFLFDKPTNEDIEKLHQKNR